MKKLVLLALLLAFAHLITCQCKNPNDCIPFLIFFGGYGEENENFNKPMGLDCQGKYLLVADNSNNRIVRYYSHSSDFQVKWGTFGEKEGQFNGPTDVAIYLKGVELEYAYVVDSGNDRIQKFDIDGNFLTSWGTSGQGDGQFDRPVSVAIDEEGCVYVTDFGNNRIQKFNSNGNFILKWGSEGKEPGQFNGPYGISTEGDENYNPKYIYVTDQGNHRVQVFTKTGELVRTFGTYGAGDGQFNSPSGITIQDGQSFIIDTGNCRYVIFDEKGRFSCKGGSKGTHEGQFLMPIEIAKDGIPLWISDEELHRISIFSGKY